MFFFCWQTSHWLGLRINIHWFYQQLWSQGWRCEKTLCWSSRVILPAAHINTHWSTAEVRLLSTGQASWTVFTPSLSPQYKQSAQATASWPSLLLAARSRIDVLWLKSAPKEEVTHRSEISGWLPYNEEELLLVKKKIEVNKLPIIYQ